MKIYIIVEKETGRFVSAHTSEYDADNFSSEYLSEIPLEYEIQERYTIRATLSLKQIIQL